MVRKEADESLSKVVKMEVQDKVARAKASTNATKVIIEVSKIERIRSLVDTKLRIRVCMRAIKTQMKWCQLRRREESKDTNDKIEMPL